MGCSPMGSHFPSENREENKEENPLLASGLAFSFGKQGGLYVDSTNDCRE